MSTPAIPKQVTLSPLYKLLCLEAAAVEAADILPKKLNDKLAANIERLYEQHKTPKLEAWGEYTDAQKKAVIQLKDSTAVFGMK